MQSQTFLWAVLVVGLLASPSEQTVREYLRKPKAEADSESSACADCDMTLLPNGEIVYKNGDPYDLEKCGSDVSITYDVCVGYQAMPKTRDEYQGPRCEDPDPDWLKCLEKTVAHSPYRPLKAVRQQLMDLEVLRTGEPYTLFIESGENVEAKEVNNSNLHLHLVKGKYYSHELYDRMHLNSSTVTSKIYHVSRIDRTLLCLDCVEIAEADRECPNGLVHILKGPIVHPWNDNSQDQQTLYQMLKSRPETADFASYLSEELQQRLDTYDAQMHYTVLAPNQEAWETLKSTYTDEELKLIAPNHVLEGFWCLEAFYRAEDPIMTPLETRLIFGVDERDGRPIKTVTAKCNEVHEIVQHDIVGQTGVVHEIAGGLIPSQVLKLNYKGELPECLRDREVEKWWDWLKECDLYVDKAVNYTMIFPVNSAFDWWENDEKFGGYYKRFLEDKEYRCETIRYHIMRSGATPNNNAIANETLPFRSNNKNNYLYEMLYKINNSHPQTEGNEVYFHYSKLIDDYPISFRGVWILRSDKVNVMPEQNITDIISQRSDTTIAAEIFAKTDFESELAGKAPRNLYLVVADSKMSEIFNEKLEKGVRQENGMITFTPMEGAAKNHTLMHWIPNYLWGGDLGYYKDEGDYGVVNAMQLNLTFRRIKSESFDGIRVGYPDLPENLWPYVLEFNVPARDGIIWVLDREIPCPDTTCTSDQLDIDVYKLYVGACSQDELPGLPNAKRLVSTKLVDFGRDYPELCHVIKVGEYTNTRVVKDAEHKG